MGQFLLSLKEFLINHIQHAWLEYIFIGLAVSGGIAVIILTIIHFIRLNKEIRDIDNRIEKSKRSANKNILTLLKKKNNKTF